MVTNEESFEYIYQYLEAFHEMSSGNNKAYWKWQIDVAKNVILQDWNNIVNLEILAAIKDTLWFYPPEKKGCYMAAWRQTMNTGVDYVEGYMHAMIPMSHAWNAFGDFHYDTMQVLDNFDDVSNARVQIIRLSPEKLEEYGDDVVGENISEFYINHVLKRR